MAWDHAVSAVAPGAALFRWYTGYSGWQSYSTVVEATTPLLKMVLGTIRMDSSMPQTKAESLAGVTGGVLAYSSLPVSLMQHHGILDNGSVLFRWLGWFWHTHETVIRPHAFVVLPLKTKCLYVCVCVGMSVCACVCEGVGQRGRENVKHLPIATHMGVGWGDGWVGYGTRCWYVCF